jgi:hypothetical protein
MNESASDQKARRAAEEDWKGQAALIVAGIVNALQVRGWNVAVISIARRVEVGGRVISPGASILSVEAGMEPALPGEARNLRKMADDLDKMFADSGAVEAASGHVEELIGPWGRVS